MSILNNVELLVITIVLGLFFIALLVLTVQVIQVINKIKRLTDRAESVIDNVESAAQTIKNFSEATSQRFPLLNLVHKFFDMSTKNKSK